jgi:hypothetical protein
MNKIADLKILALYLPQFHRDEFNDKWWGEGFTEWDNVKKAVPLFVGHLQPRVPAEGYYDLLDEGETLMRQYEKARKHGIHGFIMYDYWYEGVRILKRPIDYILNNEDLPFSFSICWANHSWTRTWLNRSGARDVLIEQTYESRSNYEDYFLYLERLFLDHRYIRIDDSVLYHIYQPKSIPNLSIFINELRNFFLYKHSLKLHISAVITNQNQVPEPNLFDSFSFSQPVNSFRFRGKRGQISLTSFLDDRLEALLPTSFFNTILDMHHRYIKRVKKVNYEDLVKLSILQLLEFKKTCKLDIFPYVFVDFDNSPRYKRRGRVTIGFTPGLFIKLFKLSLNAIESNSNRVIIINAWNEWGEGMYLESDLHYGDSKLVSVSDFLVSLKC